MTWNSSVSTISLDSSSFSLKWQQFSSKSLTWKNIYIPANDNFLHYMLSIHKKISYPVYICVNNHILQLLRFFIKFCSLSPPSLSLPSLSLNTFLFSLWLSLNVSLLPFSRMVSFYKKKDLYNIHHQQCCNFTLSKEQTKIIINRQQNLLEVLPFNLYLVAQALLFVIQWWYNRIKYYINCYFNHYKVMCT